MSDESFKTVKVDYWDKKVDVRVPADAFVVETNDAPPLADPQAAIAAALENPIGASPLRLHAKPGMKVTIAFDDPIRAALPRQQIIAAVLDVLNGQGIPDQDITLVSANGHHCLYTKDQFRAYLGPAIFDRFWSKGSATRILNHNASDRAALVYMGVSEMGDYVEYNRLLVDSDLFIYTGTVGPTNWGGMSGTGVVIGLASDRSMGSTHSHDVIGDPASCNCDQRASFYRQHKQTIMAHIERFTGKRVFYVDAVMGAGGRIAGVFAGYSPEINEATWELVERHYKVEVPQADVLVLGITQTLFYGESSNPLLSLVGACTPCRFWLNKPLLREGGVVIALAKCGDLIDPRKHPSYAEALRLFGNCFEMRQMCDYEDEFNNRPDYLFQYHHGHGYHPLHPFWIFYESAYALDWASAVIMAGVENPGAVRQMGCVPARSFDEALLRARKIVGPNPRVVVLPEFYSRNRVQFWVE